MHATLCQETSGACLAATKSRKGHRQRVCVRYRSQGVVTAVYLPTPHSSVTPLKKPQYFSLGIQVGRSNCVRILCRVGCAAWLLLRLLRHGWSIHHPYSVGSLHRVRGGVHGFRSSGTGGHGFCGYLKVFCSLSQVFVITHFIFLKSPNYQTVLFRYDESDLFYVVLTSENMTSSLVHFSPTLTSVRCRQTQVLEFLCSSSLSCSAKSTEMRYLQCNQVRVSIGLH